MQSAALPVTPGLQVEGKIDKAKGTARQAVGDAKDAARDAIDTA